MKKVSILGCGWVGEALKKVLEDDYEVVCLSRDMVSNHQASMYDCDSLVIAIPPRNDYIEVLQNTLKNIEMNTQVILLSSISFYDGKPLVVEAESVVHSIYKGAVVLRLGGLMGYDRIAGKYTAGKVLTSDSSTNYVHRDDVVGIIEMLIKKQVEDDIFDVVSPIQTSKKSMFAKNAQRFGFEKTEFLAGEDKGKCLSPTKLVKALDYRFKKENVKHFWD